MSGKVTAAIGLLGIVIGLVAGRLDADRVFALNSIAAPLATSSADGPGLHEQEEKKLTSQAALLAREYPSILVTNREDGKTVEQRALRRKIYDLSFIVYSRAFAAANNLIDSPFYIDDTLPPDILAAQITVSTDHAHNNCELRLLFRETSTVASPPLPALDTTLRRDDGFRLPWRNRTNISFDRRRPFSLLASQVRPTDIEYSSYISVGSLFTGPNGKRPDYISLQFLEYSEDYFSKAKYFRFQFGCEGLATGILDRSLNLSISPMITLAAVKDKANAPRRATRLSQDAFVSFALPRKLAQRALPWLKDVAIHLPIAKGEGPDDSNSLRPGRLIQHIDLE